MLFKRVWMHCCPRRAVWEQPYSSRVTAGSGNLPMLGSIEHSLAVRTEWVALWNRRKVVQKLMECRC